jgi:hypothetical protein
MVFMIAFEELEEPPLYARPQEVVNAIVFGVGNVNVSVEA